MKRIFITGTGTDIGKTFVTCALTRQLIEKKINVRVKKPIVTGWNNRCDTHLLLESGKLEATEENINACTPWRFTAALSPHMAAEREGLTVDFDEVVKFCLGGDKCDYALIEGAGGVMTPVNGDKTFRDLAMAVGDGIILVAGSYLGSISHTLTALENLKGLDVIVVVNETKDSVVDLDETVKSVGRFCSNKIITSSYLGYTTDRHCEQSAAIQEVISWIAALRSQ